MGDVKETGYVCKICGKICVSGKSLGGHMRIHLADIAASREAAKEEDEGGIGSEGCDGREDGSSLMDAIQMIQSEAEERISNCNTNPDFLEFDPNSSYELRENPKKSWRTSTELKCGNPDNETTCEICRKDFPSLRSLTGHMRIHSVKKDVRVLCKECGKIFNSAKAMYGHMKTHSMRSRVTDISPAKELSCFENLCPIRRKRSRIRYHKNCTIPKLPVLSCSGFTVSEKEKEAAECLVMLSKAERNFGKFETFSCYSDDDSVYIGGVSLVKIEEVEGDLDGTFEYMASCDTTSTCKDKMEVDFPVSDDDDEESCKESSATEFDDYRDTLNGYQKELQFKLGKCTKILRSHSNLGGQDAAHKTPPITSSSSVADASCVTEVHSKVEHHSQENSVAGITRLELIKRKRYQCLVCFKAFSSGQALGGHKRAHISAPTKSKIKEEALPVKQEINDFDKLWDLNFDAATDDGIKADHGIRLWSHKHEAPVLAT